MPSVCMLNTNVLVAVPTKDRMHDRYRASYLSESVNECRASLTCDGATERCQTADGQC